MIGGLKRWEAAPSAGPTGSGHEGSGQVRGGHPGSGQAGGGHPGGAHLHGGANSDRQWLLAALCVIAAFMVGEVVAGLLAHSLALLSDAGHLLTDAAALLLAIIASRIAERPPRGAYTYGFARIDALSGQANGITLVLLAVWFTVEAIRRLIAPPDASGTIMVIVAGVGVGVNVVATALAARANRSSLNIRGAVAHLVNDLWAFVATLVAGVVILLSGWTRADAVASLVVAVLMTVTGVKLIRAAGRIFLEAAPSGMDPMAIGSELAGLRGVAQVHDLHVWELSAGKTALSAHVLVDRLHDCHRVGETLRELLAGEHGIRHVTLQVDHVSDTPEDHCGDSHGPIHRVGSAADAGNRSSR